MLMRVIRALRKRGINILGKAALRRKGVRLGGGVCLYGMPIVTLAKDSTIEVGDKVVLCSESMSTALGVSRPVILRTLRSGARISIGNDAGLSGTVVCAAVGVEIGAECLIGADVQIVDTDFHTIKPEGRRHCSDPDKIVAAPVRIGRNVFIGAGSKILKGVTIGENSVIGAGSIVTRDIPPNMIAAGNPARVLGPVSRPEELTG
jgi:acetyltransferase-like isoleucine patch superfamily enzyme